MLRDCAPVSFAFMALLALGSIASAQTVIVDTGQPPSPAAQSISLCASSCGGGSTYQNLAGQFTLTQSYSISSVQGYFGALGTGGSLAVVIRADNGGLPGASVYSQTYTIPNTSAAGWQVFTFTNQPILAANTPYWLSFEPVVGSPILYGMPEGAPNPLPLYSVYNSLNSGPFTEVLGLGMRVSGTPAVGPTLLVDTGAGLGGSNVIGSNSLFNSAPNFEYNAGQFTLSQASTIQSIQGWMQVITPGSLNVKIYAGNSTGYGHVIPGTAVYSQTYTPLATGVEGWVSFPLTAPYLTLPAGTYWVSFEPAAGAFFAEMTGGVPSPLANYAFLVNGNLNWVNSPLNLGFEVFGTQLPAASMGTAARTILTGSAFGIPDAPADFTSGGDGQANTVIPDFVIPSGWSYARAAVIPNGLLAGAYSATSGPCNSSGGSCGIAGGRGVAYRTWTNTTNQPLTFRINTQFGGGFSFSGGTASAGVYVFDATAFANTVPGGTATAQFLLNGSTLSALAGASSLASLFPSSGILLNSFQSYSSQADGLNQTSTFPLTSEFITVAVGQSVTVMFDVTAYAPDFGSANFASTLEPSTTLPLFTDQSGNAVTGLVAVGPSTAAPVTPGALTLTPATTSIPLGSNGSVTANVTDGSGNPVPNAVVFFAFNSGPNAGPGGPVSTDANGNAVFTYVGNAGAGTDQIQATVGTLTATPVSITWTVPGVLDHIAINPASATIVAGGSQAYTATGYDRLNNVIGDVTAQTTFSITPDGSCSGANCTATINGVHTVTGSDGGKTAQASLTVSALQTPVLTWTTPAAITYGTALSATQLDATANVAGTFSYSPSAGTVLSAGVHTLSVMFTPTNTGGYTTATKTVNLQVNQATPVLTWATPAPIAQGTALSSTQLDASANTAGTFVYTPAAGAVLGAGNQTITVAFTPTDTTDYTGASAQVTLLVTSGGKTAPVITWATPAAITYGTPLSPVQLNAKANVAGTFAYSPTAGTILTAGSHTLSVTFNPTNTTAYSSATASVTLTVNKATPIVLWLPLPIVYGTGLGPLQLDALTLVPGKFSYTPGAGTILPAGSQKLSAVFTPTDTADFNSITVNTILVVLKALPKVAWATPAPITVGAALSATQLDATANVPGAFVYSPAAGTKLPVGTAILTVTFTPKDTVDYLDAPAGATMSVKAH